MEQTCMAPGANLMVLPALPQERSFRDLFVGPFGLAIQEGTAWTQLPIAILILLSPLACLVLFVVSLRRTTSTSLRRRCAISTFVLPSVALALYALYESGIPSEMNIRVDLLLIYPALVLDFLFWPALLVRYLAFRRA